MSIIGIAYVELKWPLIVQISEMGQLGFFSLFHIFK